MEDDYHRCNNCLFYKPVKIIDTYQRIKYPFGAGMCERICYDTRNKKPYSPVGGKNGKTNELRVDGEFHCKFYSPKSLGT